MSLRILNKSVLPTPTATINLVQAAMNNNREVDLADLEVTIPALQGLSHGALAQIIQDSGFELVGEPDVVE